MQNEEEPLQFQSDNLLREYCVWLGGDVHLQTLTTPQIFERWRES